MIEVNVDGLLTLKVVVVRLINQQRRLVPLSGQGMFSSRASARAKCQWRT